MNQTAVFDTLRYAKKLQQAGFTEEQAAVQAEAIREIIADNLVTKTDVLEIKREIKALEEKLTYKLTVRLGSMLVSGIVVLSVLIKLF